MTRDAALVDYYAQRAAEYERIYTKPERQPDLATLSARIPELLADRHVYEVACGTGYWTQFVARSAASVFATDINDEVLALAAAKPLPAGRFTFARADAFAPPVPPHPCDGGLAAFWWSHLLRGEQLDAFLRVWLGRLTPGARVVIVDNRYVEGSSIPISRTDVGGNTYQTRRLDDGTVHEVLKNFPEERTVRAALAPYVRSVVWEELPYYWLAWADLR